MLKGIDVSYANRSVDWKEAKNEIDFAIIRSSFGSDLPSQTDSQFHYNATNCTKYNIPFGTYHFAYFVDAATAKEEANFAIRLAKEYKKVKFIALDIEEDSVAYAKRVGKNPNWTECAVVFLETIKAAGYTPVIYSNQGWLTHILDYSKIKKYKLWYAAPGAASPKYSPAIWQYSWNGKVNGVIGNVDVDYLYDESLIKDSSSSSSKSTSPANDRETFLQQAKTYIGKDGNYVCNTKLHIGAIYDWCAFAVSSIFQDCGFIGKYIKAICGGAGDIPRYSDGKYGVWFAKGDREPKAGDLIFFRYAGAVPTDKYFSSHVGIVESVNGNTLTTLEGNVNGSTYNWAETSSFKRKTRQLYNNDVYAFYRPNWEENEKSTSTGAGTNIAKGSVDVTYKVYTDGRWLPEVINTTDYAGLENKKITGLYAKLSMGTISYRVKTIGGKWLPWVDNYSDYAGILGRNIDGIQMRLKGLDDYNVMYRVSLIGSTTYLDWVTNYENETSDGYAGIIGCAIDKIQIKVVKKGG